MSKKSQSFVLIAAAIGMIILSRHALASEPHQSTLSVSLPDCNRDIDAWTRFSPYDEWMAKREQNQQKKKYLTAKYKRERATYNKYWKEQDAVDLTWIDIDGDGWCDVITSGDEEPYKDRKGKPLLLCNRAAFT